MSVTSIRQIKNESSFIVEVMSFESWNRVKLSQGEGAGTDIWIPWCTNAEEFPRHHIIVSIPGTTVGSIFFPAVPLFALWQKDNQVSFSRDAKFDLAGECVPVNCSTGGNRLLTVGGDRNNPTIKISNLP
jgi:hypothetical protein